MAFRREGYSLEEYNVFCEANEALSGNFQIVLNKNPNLQDSSSNICVCVCFIVLYAHKMGG